MKMTNWHELLPHYMSVRRENAMGKTYIRPFRVGVVVLGAAVLLAAVRFPAHAASIERQREELSKAAARYLDAQSVNNRLRGELAEIDTDAFIERTARREYGYCWYGETIYEVANLEEIREQAGESAPD